MHTLLTQKPWHLISDQLPVYKAIVVVIIVALQSSELKRMVRNIRAKLATNTTDKEAA